MDDDISRNDIARIEARIEELAQSIERCRKLSLLAKVAIAAGAIWVALTLFGAIEYVPFMTIGALAAVIGGFVLLGSNSTSWIQAEDALRASEAMRAQMISQLELRVIDGGVRRLH